MFANNEMFTRLAAGFGAVALTLTLLVTSFSTPQNAAIAMVLA